MDNSRLKKARRPAMDRPYVLSPQGDDKHHERR
jgi:hypothetical protein